MCVVHLHVGGLVAMGFDASGRYLLTVSHSGRGVFDSGTWKRVARDDTKSYPHHGVAIGIGPIENQRLPVSEIDYQSGVVEIVSLALGVTLSYESGVITVSSTGT